MKLTFIEFFDSQGSEIALFQEADGKYKIDSHHDNAPATSLSVFGSFRPTSKLMELVETSSNNFQKLQLAQFCFKIIFLFPMLKSILKKKLLRSTECHRVKVQKLTEYSAGTLFHFLDRLKKTKGVAYLGRELKYQFHDFALVFTAS